MPDQVRRRRVLRAHRGLPDSTDLPIESRYIAAVLQLGGALHSKSRWLNGIGLEATTTEIHKIARLACVRRN